MPRIRYLKPEFFSDEDIAELPFQTRLTYAGLWCYADKEGRLEDRPRFLKAMIFPYDKIDIEREIELLAKPKHGNGAPYLIRYETEGKRYIEIINWHKHQKPHHTEKDSIFPPAPPFKVKVVDKEKDKPARSELELSNGLKTVKERLKSKYGEFNNVFLHKLEFNKLMQNFGDIKAKAMIENISTYLASKGDKYKSHYATILSWERKNPLEVKYGTEKHDPSKPPSDPIERRLWEIDQRRIAKENKAGAFKENTASTPIIP